MDKSETKYVKYYVEVEWTSVNFSENNKQDEGQQFSVVKRFKNKVDTIMEPYPVGQVDLYLLGNSVDTEKVNNEKTENNHIYQYGVKAIIFEGEYDNAPGRRAFEDSLRDILDNNKTIRVKQTDKWEQRDPSVSL